MAELDASTDFACTASSLENFALSFSTRVETDFSKIKAARERLEGAERASHEAMGSNVGQYSPEDPKVVAEENFPGIARMLSRMTNLDAFDLHMTNTLRGQAHGYEKIFTAIANNVKLPLTQVFLRGLPASQESLLKFIDNHPNISDLTIHEMNLTSGDWTYVIQHLCQMPALSLLSLSNLWSEQGVYNLLFKSDGNETISRYSKMGWTYPCMRVTHVHTRKFDREEIECLKGRIDFDNRDTGRPLGSPQLMRWANNRRFNYLV